jgi:hypothetical protein
MHLPAQLLLDGMKFRPHPLYPKNSSCLIGLREEVVDTVRDERRKSTD